MAGLARPEGAGKPPLDRRHEADLWVLKSTTTDLTGAGPREATRGGVNGRACPARGGGKAPSRSTPRSGSMGSEINNHRPDRCRAARRDARRGEWPGLPGQRGRESPLSIDAKKRIYGF